MTNALDPIVIVGGGQSGLSAARAVRDRGARPLVLEAGETPAGSWPSYYDSLALFSPARYSGMPGQPFPGDPDHYPARDEVAAYLRRYASGLDVEIRTGTRVTAVRQGHAGDFTVLTSGGEEIRASGVVAASGSFGNPYIPDLPGLTGFTGDLLHVAAYRNPEPYEGKRVVVVGGGNSAVQVAYELAKVASVTLATRSPLLFTPQLIRGKDLHYWLETTGFDRLPPEWLARIVPGRLVLDTGDYRSAFESGRFDRRPMFTGFDGDRVLWRDGEPEPVDTVIFATGYRPDLGYLEPLGALEDGLPKHAGGISTTHLGLAYVGLEFQRSFASNTLRGAHSDAEYVAGPLVAHAGKAAVAFGF